MKKETAFIRKGLTFWKCNICRGWHEGEIHKCPMKQHKKELEELKDRLFILCNRYKGGCPKCPFTKGRNCLFLQGIDKLIKEDEKDN